MSQRTVPRTPRRTSERTIGVTAGPARPSRESMTPMADGDIERFEEEREMELYREYRDVLPMFAYVIETERRFYLANKVEMLPVDDGWVQALLPDAGVGDMSRPARCVSSVQVRPRRDVNVEELRRDDTTIP